MFNKFLIKTKLKYFFLLANHLKSKSQRNKNFEIYDNKMAEIFSLSFLEPSDVFQFSGKKISEMLNIEKYNLKISEVINNYLI